MSSESEALATATLESAVPVGGRLRFAALSVPTALMFIVGVTAVLTQSLTNTTLQLAAPDRLRGRVMGAYSFGTQGLRVVNGPLLGGAASLLGAPVAVAAAAGVVLVGLAGILAKVPQLRVVEADVLVER